MEYFKRIKNIRGREERENVSVILMVTFSCSSLHRSKLNETLEKRYPCIRKTINVLRIWKPLANEITRMVTFFFFGNIVLEKGKKSDTSRDIIDRDNGSQHYIVVKYVWVVREARKRALSLYFRFGKKKFENGKKSNKINENRFKSRRIRVLKYCRSVLKRSTEWSAIICITWFSQILYLECYDVAISKSPNTPR